MYASKNLGNKSGEKMVINLVKKINSPQGVWVVHTSSIENEAIQINSKIFFNKKFCYTKNTKQVKLINKIKTSEQ